MATKYTRQIMRARKMIAKKGTTCTWYKPIESADDDNSLPPEMQGETDPRAYPNIPIVFYPQDRLELYTTVGVKVTQTTSDQLFGMIPGDVPFTPAQDDAVLIAGQTMHVDTVNTIQPDMTPIIYEVSFK